MNIILSIKPKYAELIYSGKKTIEWRHTYPEKFFKLRDRVYIYETAPVRRVTGYFRVNPIIDPIILEKESFKFISPYMEKQIENWGQVSIDELKKYAERSIVYGWHIIKAERYVVKVHLNWFNLKRPPQSWQYLNTNKEVKK